MKFLVTIVERHHANKFTDILNKVPRFQVTTFGKGTASSEILDYFGIGETEKDVIFCFIEDEDVSGVFEEFQKHREFTHHGAVAFTINVSDISKKFYNIIKALEEKSE